MFSMGERSASVLEHYREVIEEILAELGIDPSKSLEEATESEHYSWCVKRGSANVFIELFTQNNESYFMVDCPILTLPAQNLEGFFRRLLEVNDRLVEASLVLRGQEVHIVGIRPLKGLDSVEASTMLDSVSAWADHLDNALSEEFGAPLWQPVPEEAST